MADTHTPATVLAALCRRLDAAGFKPGASQRATNNPAPLAHNSYTCKATRAGDTGELRTRSSGRMYCRVDFAVELLHVAPPKGSVESHEQKRLEEWVAAIKHIHVENTDLTREATVQVGDAMFDDPGGGAYLRTTFAIAVQFAMGMAL